jgi:hypothetical protein
MRYDVRFIFEPKREKEMLKRHIFIIKPGFEELDIKDQIIIGKLKKMMKIIRK